MKKNEIQLIEEYLTGNDNSFRELVSIYLKSIYSFSFRLTGSRTDSEDISQEVFIKVWKNLRKYDKEQSFKTWIFTIARNTIFDWLRKKKDFVFSDFENDNGDNQLIDNLSDTEKSLEDIYYDSESLEKIRELINKLSKSEQEVIFLRHENELTFEEISKILNKSLNTVKSSYRRSVLKIKKNINAPK